MTSIESLKSELSAAAAAAAVAHELSEQLPDKARLYLLGNGGDFVEFAKQVALLLEDRIDGVGCLWSYPSENLRMDGGRIFSIADQFIETPIGQDTNDNEGLALLVCQTYVADANQLILAISRMVSDFTPTRVYLGAYHVDSRELQKVVDYFEGEYEVISVHPSPESVIELDLFQNQQNLFEALDTRPRKAGPRISRWLLNRMNRFAPKSSPPTALRPLK